MIGMRKTFTLIALVCLGMGLNAQLVRTDMGDLNDSQVYRKADTTGVVDGPAGNGQSWDFSTLVATSVVGTNRYIVASGHPQGSNWPTANMAFSPFNDAYQFYISTADSLYLIGEKSPANTRMTYTNGAALFRYPQGFGVQNEDSVEATYPDGFISSVTRLGWTRTTFDGTGSLITPYATYPNVKRIEYLAIHHDSSWTGAADVVVNVRRYEWYAAGEKMPVLITNYQQVILNGGNPTISREVFFADPTAVAVTPEMANQFEIYPNPSQGNVQVRYALDAASDVQVEVLNVMGERVRLVVDENQAAGTHVVDLGQDLAKGLYLVRLNSSNGASTLKMILN